MRELKYRSGANKSAQGVAGRAVRKKGFTLFATRRHVALNPLWRPQTQTSLSRFLGKQAVRTSNTNFRRQFASAD